MRALLLLLALALPSVAARAADDLLADLRQDDAAIAARVESLLTRALLRDREAVQVDLGDLTHLDDSRTDAGLSRTGLLDDARYLAAALEPTRDARRHALEALEQQHPDPMVEKLADARLATDDGLAADRLLTDDRHNRRANLVNDAIRPLGIFSGAFAFAALNPFLLAGSVLDSVSTTAINLWNYNHLTSPEREALVRYRTLLRRAPDSADAADAVEAIHQLAEKRAKALCEDTVDRADAALDADDPDHALFYVTQAEATPGCGDDIAKLATQTRDALAERAKREEVGRWPIDDPIVPADGAEADDYAALAYATVADDPTAMKDAARHYLDRHEDSHLKPAAAFVLAVGLDREGSKLAARKALDDVAGDDDAQIGRDVAALLASPDYNRLDGIHAAESRHARDVAKFVLVGEGMGMDGRTAMYTAAQFGAASVQAAESFGIFNVIGVLTRAWRAWRADPTSNQEIIDRGEEFLAREPTSPDAPEVHDRLANAYERAQNYGRAIMHVQALPETDKKRVDKLEEKLADQLLQEAEKAHNDPVVLRGLVRHFGATSAAETARERLKGVPDDDSTALDRDILRDHPELLGPSALDIDPRLLDGDKKNGELADEGVTLRRGELRLSLNEGGDTPRIETRTMPPEAFARAAAAAEDVLYTRLVTTERRNEDEGRYERYIPFFIQGSLDESGAVAVAPGVKMRRYSSPDRALYE